MTEVWFRNTATCIKECVERQVRDMVFDRGYLYKRNMDPNRYVELYYGNLPYRLLTIGTPEQATQELVPGHTLDRPAAQHPTWAYGESWDRLESAMADPEKYGFRTAPGYDADPRVVVTDLPMLNTAAAKSFMRQISELQAEYSDTVLHVHGLYSFRFAFGLGFGSVDYEPRTLASKGKVVLPNGKEVTYERAGESPQWVTLIGFMPSDLRVPRNRCMYNIESARWAGRHFTDEIRFEHRRTNPTPDEVDSESSPPRTNRAIMVRRQEFQSGDKWLCDLCNLQNTCKYFRTGSVCVVPDSEPMELARLFGSRDSDQIIEGLGALMGAQSRRLNRAMDEELHDPEQTVNPEVTKIINTLFDRGVKLAKLLNPALASASAPKVNVNFGNQIAATNPNQLMARVYEELQSRGIRREDITPEMVEQILKKPDDLRERAIEAAVSERAR
jgi:hypothetical protein